MVSYIIIELKDVGKEWGFIRQTTCGIVGNRLIPRGQADIIANRLEKRILKLTSLGVTRFFTGGNLGFDTMAAEVVLKVRDTHPEVRLALVLPGRDQADKWPKHAVETYESIKARSDEIIYTSETSGYGSILRRNRYMMDESDYCLCYLTKNSGRTAEVVRYAERTDHPVINIALDKD